MQEPKPWHEQDEFWDTFAPTLFTEEHWSRAPEEVEHIISLLGIKDGARVLDLCCGPGRHSLELARRGFRVTGVDRTQRYLDSASQQAEEKGLEVEFVLDDMRIFCRADAFDAVINVYTAFGYFEDPEDDHQVVMNVFRSLRSGGVFLLDMMSKEVLARKFRERDWREQDGVLVLQEREVARNWSWIENRWILLKGNERTEFRLSHRLYSATELMSLLTTCGFGQVDAYGDLEDGAYDHTASRLVVVGRK